MMDESSLFVNFPLPPAPQMSGRAFESAKVTPNPIRESAVSWRDQVRRVSFSFIPLSRDTTQKPLSFIQEQNMAPNPMERKR
jgi:hypothetical protein